jgi:hypothetical protein
MRKVWVRLVENDQPDDGSGCWVEMYEPDVPARFIKPGFRITQVSDKGPQDVRPGGEGN